MSKAAKGKAPIDQSEEIEERATDLDRLAHELYLSGARLSPITNQLWHFLSDPKLKDSRSFYRKIAKRALAWPDEPTCLKCGCTESNACEGGCSWTFLSKERNWGLCSACFEILAMEN